MKESQDRKRIAIVGLGLIGSSLGLALKQGGLREVEIVGHDLDRGVANKAQRLGAIDRAEHNLSRAVTGASLVIIATPVLAVREVMAQIAADLAEGAVVTDTASTKVEVMRWAGELLPAGVHFVGGHPMAGKERAGAENAEATLFRDKAYCLCPAVGADEAAVRAIIGMIRMVGAEPLFIDPAEHDQYAAAVSHLPLVLSAALFTLLRTCPAWPDLGAMTSSAFRDLTRLASADPRMSHDIFVTNREAVIHWLDRMREELGRYRELIQGEPEEMFQAFARAQLERDAFIAQPPSRHVEGEMPDVRQAFMDSLIGGWTTERLRRAKELPGLLKEARQRVSETEEKRGPTLAERIAEDIRRDIEKRPPADK